MGMEASVRRELLSEGSYIAQGIQVPCVQRHVTFMDGTLVGMNKYRLIIQCINSNNHFGSTAPQVALVKSTRYKTAL